VDTRRAFLTDRTALVTGAGAGIGKGIALAFASFGARVAALEIDETRARATAAEIEAAGGQALALVTDVRDGEALARAVAATVERFGAIDILVNNVGGTFRAPFLDVAEKGWDAIVRTNLKTVLHGTRAVAPGMIARGRGGSIVNIVSIEGVRAAPLYAAYAACKAGIINFTQSMALELGPHRIREEVPSPGKASAGGDDVLVGRIRRDPTVENGLALFLACDLSRFVTGATLHVDGGTHAAAGWYRDPGSGEWILGPGRRPA